MSAQLTYQPGAGLVVIPDGGTVPYTIPAVVVIDPATGLPQAAGGGGGGGGGAVTVADGADVAQGAKADAAATADTGTFSVVALIKRGLANWTSLLAKIPALSTGAIPVETVKQALVARQLTAAASSGASANQALTTTTRRISIYARTSDIRYAIGSAAQTASATTHYIAQGERLDLAVPATPNIAVLSASTTPGVLEVTELS